MSSEGLFSNGDTWDGHSYLEDGIRWYSATDEQGREYETEEVPVRHALDFGLVQFVGECSEDQVKDFFNG